MIGDLINIRHFQTLNFCHGYTFTNLTYYRLNLLILAFNRLDYRDCVL